LYYSEKIPLLRFFIPLISGVFLAPFINSDKHFLFYVFLLVLAACMCFHFCYKIKDEKKEFKNRWINGFFINILLLIAGMLLVQNHNHLNDSRHFSKYQYKNNLSILEVIEAPGNRKNSVKAVLAVKALHIDNKWIKTKGKIIQYFEKDSMAIELKYGDVLIQKALFTDVKAPQNPHEFNYKRYLENNNIFHQSYVRQNNWQKISNGKGNTLIEIGSKAKAYITKKIEEAGINDKEYGLVTALLLGMSDNLDVDTLKNFSAAGAMHVLCVSGLHVGIFFLILGFVFSFLNRYKNGRYVKAVLIIMGIWFYALITGFAPSVLRASAMFSIILIGNTFKKKTSIYNTLVFSALILIVLNPGIISKAGFWLSYLAVIGIVYLYPKFYSLFNVKNYVLEKTWSLLCVSMAAQIATAPLAVYYFNQFPNYFLLSNIIVVPLATIIVYLGVSLIALSFIPFISSILGFALGFLLKSLNTIVAFIENLPYSASIIVIDKYQMLLFYVFVILLFAYFEKLKPVLLKLSLLSLIVFFAISSYNSINAQNQKKMVMYSIDKGLAIDIIHGQKALFIADSMLLKKPEIIDFHIKGNRNHNNIDKVSTIAANNLKHTDSIIDNILFIYKNFIGFADSKIGIVQQNQTFANTQAKINLNMLLINEIPYKNNFLLQSFNNPCMVFSKNVKNYKQKRFVEKNKISADKIYDIKTNGAFVNRY